MTPLQRALAAWRKLPAGDSHGLADSLALQAKEAREAAQLADWRFREEYLSDARRLAAAARLLRASAAKNRVETPQCKAEKECWGCTRRLGHRGRHEAWATEPDELMLAWRAKPAKRAKKGRR